MFGIASHAQNLFCIKNVIYSIEDKNYIFNQEISLLRKLSCNAQSPRQATSPFFITCSCPLSNSNIWRIFPLLRYFRVVRGASSLEGICFFPTYVREKLHLLMETHAYIRGKRPSQGHSNKMSCGQIMGKHLK